MNLASSHVLEIHSNLRCNTFAESQVGCGELTSIRSHETASNTFNVPQRRTPCRLGVELESRTFSTGVWLKYCCDREIPRLHDKDTSHVETR